MKSFEKLQKMVDNDSKNIQLAPLSNVISVNIKGGKGEVTFGVSIETAQSLMLGVEKFVGGFVLADREEFDSIV